MEFTSKLIERIHSMERSEIIEIIRDIAKNIHNLGGINVLWNTKRETPFVLGVGGIRQNPKELVVHEIVTGGYVVARFGNEDIEIPINHFSESLLRQLLVSYIYMCKKHLTKYTFEKVVEKTKNCMNFW